jgi:hypothetical protein
MSSEAIRDWYRNRILNNIPFLLAHFDTDRGTFRSGSTANQHCLRPLAYFYKHEAKGNSYFGDRDVLDKVLRAGDHMVASAQESPNDGTLGGEWAPYNLVECLDWLRDEIDTERRMRWHQAITKHIELLQRVNNYIATAPNHFIWRAALLMRAARLFEVPSWEETARMLARQVCKMQTCDGYWDEAHRGHGPSPSYHRVHLHGLDLYYRLSGDEDVRPALQKGIEFAVRAAYPDGVPIETFDGRQPYVATFSMGMAANALSRTREGRMLLLQQIRRLTALGCADAYDPCGFALTWYAFSTTDFMIDCFRFCEEGDVGALPQEKDGFSDHFTMTKGVIGTGALVKRKESWFLALSAIESDVSRFIGNVYITERQSGLSIYHPDAGIVVGGGNRVRNTNAPLTNAILINGWKGVDCHAGIFSAEHVAKFPPGSGGEGLDAVKSCYHPIRRDVAETEAGAALLLEFLHGSIRFDAEIASERRLIIRYKIECVGTQKILLQIPVPLFHHGTFELDGVGRQIADLEDIQSLPIRTKLSIKRNNVCVNYTMSEQGQTLFTYPIEPVKNWKFEKLNYVPDETYFPLYTVGQISVEMTAQNNNGVLLQIDVEKHSIA